MELRQNPPFLLLVQFCLREDSLRVRPSFAVHPPPANALRPFTAIISLVGAHCVWEINAVGGGSTRL